MKDLLSTKQAAEALGLSSERILQLIRAGRLPAVKLSGVWLISSHALASFERRPIGYPRGRPRKPGL